MNTTEFGKIKSLADEYRNSGFTPKAEMGQHFLRSEVVAHSMAVATLREDPALVLEIGAGLGTLSASLCALGLPLWAVEIDSRLEEVLTDRLKPFGELARVTITDFFTLPEDQVLPKCSVLTSILPFEPGLASRLLLHALSEYVTMKSAIVLVPTAVASDRNLTSLLEFEHLEMIESDAFWPRYPELLALFRVTRRTDGAVI